MFKTVKIKDCRIEDLYATVLYGDVFLGLKKIKKKSEKGVRRLENLHNHCETILDSLSEGRFCGVITNQETKIAIETAGKGIFNGFLNKTKTDEKIRLFEVVVAPSFSEYRKFSAYRRLFRIHDTKNLCTPNMTSIIAAVELKIPLVGYAYDIWKFPNLVRDAYRERYDERTFPYKDIIFTPQDFYKGVLP